MDTQPAPLEDTESSLRAAQDKILGLMNPETEETESEEAKPTEEEESTEETTDEAPEEESEEESEEEESEEGEEPEEAEEEVLYAVKVDGEEVEIPLDELMKGYSRQSSYTRKSQKLAEQQKEFETAKNNMVSEYTQIQQERSQYVQALQNLAETQMGALGQWSNIDWETMKRDDPIEFSVKREEYREAQDNFKRVQEEQARVQQLAADDYQKQQQEFVQKEYKALVDQLPEWGEPEKQKKLAAELKSYASNQGFAEEEVDALIDHRVLLMLRKAWLYDQLQTTDVKGKKLKNKPRVVRAGAGRDKARESKKMRNAKLKRLQETGHVNDAAAVLEEMFK